MAADQAAPALAQGSSESIDGFGLPALRAVIFFFVYCGFILYLFFIASFQKKKKKKEKFLQQVPVSVRINSFNCKRPTSQLQSLYIKPSPFDLYLNRESTLSPRLIEF